MAGESAFKVEGVVVEAPIHLLFIASSERTANFPRVLIVAGENSRATIIENYVSAATEEYLTNGVVEDETQATTQPR